MKIANTYITNIACLQQCFKNQTGNNLFDLVSEFWSQRSHFSIDFSPEHIYYWNSAPDYRVIYTQICSFIDKFEEGTCVDADEERGINDICTFIGVSPSLISRKDRNMLLGKLDVDTDNNIIQVVGGRTYDLSMLVVAEKNVTLRKFEAVGGGVARIILNDMSIDLENNECVYVVSADGHFVLILPNKISCDLYDLELINMPGKFSSKLHKSVKIDYLTPADYDDVTSMSIIDGSSLIYVDSKHKMHYPDLNDSLLSIAHQGFAIFTNSCQNNMDGLVFYSKAGNNFVKTIIRDRPELHTNVHFAFCKQNNIQLN